MAIRPYVDERGERGRFVGERFGAVVVVVNI